MDVRNGVPVSSAHFQHLCLQFHNHETVYNLKHDHIHGGHFDNHNRGTLWIIFKAQSHGLCYLKLHNSLKKHSTPCSLRLCRMTVHDLILYHLTLQVSGCKLGHLTRCCLGLCGT